VAYVVESDDLLLVHRSSRLANAGFDGSSTIEGFIARVYSDTESST
jgi:hypothetical protein